MNTREFKNQMYDELAAVAKAIGNPHRLEMIELLAQGAKTVEELAEQADMSIASASQHLQRLKNARLVVSRKQATYRRYELRSPQVFAIAHAIRGYGFAENGHIKNIMQHFYDDEAMPELLDSQTLLRRMSEKNIILLDVRPRSEYDAGHIRSARSVPESELEQMLQELPNDREIVAYCRGPLCTMADDAVRLLRRRGYKAYKLDVGFPEWKMQQLPVSA
ncbi:MAG: ArsR/SmtB family transcription factor [Cyclonatronaceae bacterium]